MPIKLANGDSYDSTLQVMDDNYSQVAMFNNVSTIPSRLLFNQDQYKLHGVLTPNVMGGVWFHGSHIGWAFKLFRIDQWENVKTVEDVKEEWRVFDSVKVNPSMENKKLISQPCIHSGCTNSNGSMGCLTIYYPDFQKFARMWKPNDKVEVTLIVMADYQYPAL